MAKRELLFSTTILAKDEEVIEVDTLLAGNKVRIGFRFTPVKDEGKPEGSVSWKWTGNDRVDFVLAGFSNPLGASYPDHLAFGEVAGRPLLVNLATSAIGVMHVLHLVVYFGEKP